ncbi:unnamed protein product [Penicillium egyptiacum]|uniref:Uncharacterized protein n=1 Tax=Penicillium egyptiacum TaxID=1303716 RepID=A0A9W4KI56_9EURO|nr:unnamed protein product [Penicillium egyptiacum]
MEDHATWRSAIPGSPILSSEEDTTGFDNEPTSANNATQSRPSHLHSHATLEILQAHLDADADSDSSEASGPRVHPDFFVHLENLRRVNEANRVNARREAEARHQASLMLNQSQYEASHMLDESQHEASRMLAEPQHEASRILDEPQHEASRMINESNHESSQFANEFNQPSYHAGAEHGLQPSAMGVREQYETEDSTPAGPFQPMPHVRFETPNSAGHVQPRDHSHHHRPPSPYPTAGRRQPAFPNHTATPSTTAPQPHGYTEHGNPYRLPFEPAPFPEDAIHYDSERILQAWLIRQQLIAGVRPEDIQPMAQSEGRRHRTPPYILLNDSGAHIIRVDPARFEGAMLPLPALPWLPRRPNHNSPTAPVSSNTLDGSGPPTAPDSANTLNSPAAPNPLATTNSPVPSHLPAAATLPADPNSANVHNSPVTPDPSAAQNVPVAPSQPAALNPPAGSHLQAAATLLAALSPPESPTIPADPSPASTLNYLVSPSPSAATSSPAGSHLQAAATLLAALTPPAAPALPDNSNVVSDPTFVPEQSPEDPNEHVAESVYPDPRMVAFFQPLRLHEPANSVSASVSDLRPERPSISEPGSNENSQTPGATLHSQLQASMSLAVQNRTDTDSISSQEVPGVEVPPTHLQGRDSLTLSSLSNEGTETGHVSSTQAPHGNGVLHHTVTWSEPEDTEESAASRVRRFFIDGVDESPRWRRLSGEVKAAGDQSSLGGLM